jgi:site-specific recombinase XerD
MVRQSTDYANAKIDAYLNILEKNKKAKLETIREYRRLLRHAVKALLAAGMNATPSRIGEDEMTLLQDEVYAHLDPVTNRRQIGIFGTYLKHYDNNVLEKMHLAWPQGRRLSVKWLPPEQCVKLLDAAEGMERMIVHFELLLLMRRCEVKRLTIQDVQLNLINVLGKGRAGGKWRNLPWARSTLTELEYYQQIRERTISEALSRRPEQAIPENFLLYAQYGWKLGSYQDSSIDAMIKSAAARAGIHPGDVSNHVLRRSGAMMMDEAGVPIEDISDMLGHADLKQTRIYLGRTVKKLEKAQQRYVDYIEDVRASMRADPKPIEMYRRAPLITR